ASWIIDDEVHLRVVEQRVLVEVRRPEGQPTVVDDADLGVDVYGLCRTTATRNERAAQQPAVGIGLAEHPELAAGVVCARARVAGQHQDHSELVGWRRSEQLREDLDNLARPEELVLEVDEGASRPESPDVRLQDREV